MLKRPSNKMFFMWFIFLLMVDGVLGLSFNQPKFCPILSWQTNGTTFPNITILGYHPLGLFIDNNNTIYATDRSNNRTLVWSEGSQTPARIISNNLTFPIGIFVTNNGDIFIDNGKVNGRVDKWSKNSTTGVPVMYVSSSCFGLFVDSNNSLYCSLQFQHRVVKLSLDESINMTVIAAGNGSCGSASHMLCAPTGIYVDINFDLYVADMGNNRIQLFKSGQTNVGITIAGNGAPGTIILHNPTGVMVDSNGYLFIVDRLNHSIIRSGPNGYHCVIGCSGANGSNPDQFNSPYNIAFGSHGNMFVMDEFNNRIQKFLIAKNTCISYNQPKLTPNATWCPDAVTFPNSSIIVDIPHGIFIDFDDTIFFAAYFKNQIIIWSNSSTNLLRNLSVNLFSYTTLFLSINGDIYFENGNEIGRIEKWKSNAISSDLVTKFNGNCFGLFIDINNTLYCSARDQHKVVSVSLNNNTNTSITIAGTGSSGSASNRLSRPWGIFVDINLDLYVVDTGNKRIQRFRSGQLNGITVAGNGIPNNLTLNLPTDVILDADSYLFIADNANHRIIRVGPTDYYCVAACSGSSGSAPSQLYKPYSLRFDSQGNIYVADEFNYRIQKFMLATNSCAETSTTIASTTNPITNSSLTIPKQDTTMESTNELMTTTNINVNSFSPSFVPQSCSDPTRIGIACNTSAAPCDMLKPCQNNGTCKNVNTTLLGYICSCRSGFNGTQCQFDNRPCKSNVCWNNGICEELSNTTFICRCGVGWQGIHCETMINYCENVKCLNNGVCRPSFHNYTCECLGGSFSGRHCEITANKIKVYQSVSKSFAYVAIIAMVSVAIFIVIMDILKYYFNIDPIRKDLKRIEGKKRNIKRKPPVTVRFTYVNSSSLPSKEPKCIIENMS